MRVPRIYTPQPLEIGQALQMEDATAHYLLRVLRLGLDRELIVFNGAGGEYRARVTQVNKKQLEITPECFVAEDRESALITELAIGLSRGERMDFIMQKATELGVTRILPLLTERTEVKLAGDRENKKLQHWRQISISAAEQCQRNRLPEILPITPLSDYLASCQCEARLVLHHRDTQGLPTAMHPASVALLIGPEGGLSALEIEAALTAGFTPLTLGPRVLRTETAPLAALSVVQYLWGDW